MKIGYVLDTTLDSDAGVQQYFKGLARFMLQNGHEVRFLVPPSRDCIEFKDYIIPFGRNITLKGNANTVPTVFLTRKRKIKKVLKKESFDIIHVSAPFSPFLGATVISEAKCPVVITYTTLSMSNAYRLGANVLKIILSRSYKKIDEYIAISEAAKKEAEDTIPGNYKIIPIGVDLQKYSPSIKKLKKFSDGKLNVLTLGRLEKRKGQKYLIKAFARVRKKFDNVRLIIVSDGPERKNLEKLAKKLGLEDVIFEGYIDEELKGRYYASADLCIFPATKGESFGVVLIESMASGKVTIAFANEGYRCVLKELPKLLIENRSTKELADTMLEFLENERLRKSYEEKCLEEADKYRWNTVGTKILEIYRGLLVRK